MRKHFQRMDVRPTANSNCNAHKPSISNDDEDVAMGRWLYCKAARCPLVALGLGVMHLFCGHVDKYCAGSDRFLAVNKTSVESVLSSMRRPTRLFACMLDYVKRFMCLWFYLSLSVCWVGCSSCVKPRCCFYTQLHRPIHLYNVSAVCQHTPTAPVSPFIHSSLSGGATSPLGLFIRLRDHKT